MYIRGVKLVLALVFLLVVCVGSALPSAAQSSSTGTVVGAVTDPSGAVISGVTVTLIDKTTNVARTTITNSTGRYIFVDVTPGHLQRCSRQSWICDHEDRRPGGHRGSHSHG